MIKINNLRKEFDRGVVALDDINVEVRDQELIALLGSSGCGKSTTLDCIAGLLDTTNGEILLDGENIAEKVPKGYNIDMVLRSYALHPHPKVIDNIASPPKQKGVGKEEHHQRTREVTKKLQIEHLLGRRPIQFSGKQQQRVAIYQALVKEPKILLLGEPISNLNVRLKIEICEVIKTIQQELKVTSIIVIRDQEEAMAIVDRIVILDNGNIQQCDTPDMLCGYPISLSVANFMGNPPMNFIDTVTEKQDGGCVYVIGDCQIPVSGVMEERMEMHVGKEVKLGVRSHQIMVERELSCGTPPAKAQIVGNLREELLATDDIGENHIHITLDNALRFQELKEEVAKSGVLYVHPVGKISAFDEKTGVNLVL